MPVPVEAARRISRALCETYRCAQIVNKHRLRSKVTRWVSLLDRPKAGSDGSAHPAGLVRYGDFLFSFGYETFDEAYQGRLVTAETYNHSLQKSIGIKVVKVERMAGLIGEKQEERQLGTAISLSESMYGV
jgi:hypothetical protein